MKVGELLSGIAGLFVAYSLLIFLSIILDPPQIEREYSTLILSRDSTLMHGFLTSDDKWRMYTRLDEITPELKKAIIFKEDRFFYYHPGLNPFSVVRAMLNNVRTGKRTSGASTITMQVARLLYPGERTYRKKTGELLRAFQLELLLRKDEILQLYLNLVPYGSNIEGVKSASVIYLGKMPNHLSLAEIATLSIIPNRPVSLRLGINNDFITGERNKWLVRYKNASLFDESFLNDAFSEPLHAFRREVPRLAPHLSLRLKSAYPGRFLIYSSLDPGMQDKAEKIVKEYNRHNYFANIKNAMALVADNETGEILAYVGSADFENNEDGGQVDGIRAVRSPGSTLKPLLYGMGIDLGLITPKLAISDVPVSFSGYEPENYDGEFHGKITVAAALAGSLNVPAVKLLADIGPDKMIHKLIEADFQSVDARKDDLGLSLILGGCGVSLEELTGLYMSFANKGMYQPLQILHEKKDTAASMILSGEACFIITEILTQLKRPDLPLAWANSKYTPKIAWKTGTSYGRRDAWSIGYNNRYTIGVWVGNFSGEGVPELSGAEKATPLLFRLFNAFDYNSPKQWFPVPEKLDLRYVCSQSGRVPSEFCHDQIIDYFIPGISSTEGCQHLKYIYVSADSTVSYCTSCLPELGYKRSLYPNPEPELITYYDEQNIPYRKIPPHNPDCERLLSGSPPRVISPVHENEYFVNIQDSMEILLSAHTAIDVDNIYWYINKKFYKSVPAGSHCFFTPPEGRVEISCSDDKGRNSDIVIFVKHVDF